MDVRPLRELLADLVGDAEARHAYGADPAGYLAAHGHSELPGELVAEAVVSYADTAPVEVASVLAPYVAAHGPVPGVETDPSWFDLLTTAEVADDPFDEHLDVPAAAGDDADPAELDFGAGADQGPFAEQEPEPTVADDAEPVDEPAQAQEELPVADAEAPFVPEPPIDGLDEDDDEPLD